VRLGVIRPDASVPIEFIPIESALIRPPRRAIPRFLDFSPYCHGLLWTLRALGKPGDRALE
jgi:hypothetical protein